MTTAEKQRVYAPMCFKTCEGEAVCEVSCPLPRHAQAAVRGLAKLIAQNSQELSSKDLLIRELKLDPVTGLLNRNGLIIWLNENLSLNDEFIVVIVDVRGMKQVNDQINHFEGDELLLAVARLLAELSKEVAIPAAGLELNHKHLDAISNAPRRAVSRTGGDEFALVIEVPDGHDTLSIVGKIAERLDVSIFDIPFGDEGLLRPSLRYGISALSECGSYSEALRLADHRMVRARDQEVGVRYR